MIQVQTELHVADNTGAKKVECIKLLDDFVDFYGFVWFSATAGW